MIWFIYGTFFLICLASAIFYVKKSKRKTNSKFKILCIFLFILGVCIIVFGGRLDKYLNGKYLNGKIENLAYDSDSYDSDSYDSDCGYKEYQHNKKIGECNDKCEIVDEYSEYAFYQRYINKYGEKPKENCYHSMLLFGESVCLDFEYPRDFSYKYTGYNEWINEKFPSYVEKIKEYNRCIRKCGPMVEQPMCLG